MAKTHTPTGPSKNSFRRGHRGGKKINTKYQDTVKRLQGDDTYKQVRVLYQDEAGFGRISKIGSCWCPPNSRATVPKHHIREYRYCYGAVDAHTGESFFIIAGNCNTAWMQKFLDELAAYYPDDYLMLVMDNAAWHKAGHLIIPDNMAFIFIPPYTPQMNPIEQIWAQFRRMGFSNQAFNTLNDVIDRLEETIHQLTPAMVQSIVKRKWLPQAVLN